MMHSILPSQSTTCCPIEHPVSAYQAHEQKIVCDLSAAAADAAGAIFAAIQQLTSKQVQLQNSELPSNPSATKEQLEEAIQELQSAVTSLVESAALQGTQIGVLQEQIAELQAKAELATKAQGTADSDAHILRQQLSAAEVQIEKLQSELQLVRCMLIAFLAACMFSD